MVQRLAPKSSLDLLCEVALAHGDDAIVSELAANDLRNENDKAAKRAASGVLDLDEILKLTAKQLVKHFTLFESNELKRTFKHTCCLVPSLCQYETTSFGGEAKSLRDIKRHLQEHLQQLSAENTGRNKFTAETIVPLPRRLVEARFSKKSPAKAPRESRPSFLPEPAAAQLGETPVKTPPSPKRPLARRSPPPERPARRTPGKPAAPRKRPSESPPPALVSPQPPRRRVVEPPPPPTVSPVSPVSWHRPRTPPAPPPPPPPPPPPRHVREHDYARGGALSSSTSLLEAAIRAPLASATDAEPPSAAAAGPAATTALPEPPDIALLGLMDRELIEPDSSGGGEVPLVGAEQVVRAPPGVMMRSGDLPVIMQAGATVVTGLRRYTRVVERDEYKEQRKPKGLAKFISQSEGDKEKARQALSDMRLKTSMCNNYVCRVCFPPQRFTALSSLQSHYKSHLGIKEFSCKLCFKSFTRKMSLDYHMLIHEHKTRFRCDVCSHEFRHKSHYTEHLRRHTGETPYVCSECGQGFKAKNSYRRHLESKHGQRLTHTGNIVILTNDEHRRLREKSNSEERSRKRRFRPQGGAPAPASPSKTGFSMVDVVVRHATGQVEYMCNADTAMPPPLPPPLLRPERDVLQQAVDEAVLPELQMLPALPSPPASRAEAGPAAHQHQQQRERKGAEPAAVLAPPQPRVNLTSSIGKYNVFYSSGNVTGNVMRLVKK